MENNKIVIENPNQCMEILNTILDNSYPQERIKYASYVAMTYFVKNLNSFNKDYIEKILSYETLGKNISGKFSYELLENAVKNNAIFPAYSKTWFNNLKANQELLQQYLSILINSDDNQQIKDFCDTNPVLSKNYYVENYPKNHAFEKSVIANNPSQLINQKSLTEADIIELIENGNLKYEHFKRVFSKYSYKVQSLVSKSEIEFILNYDINIDDKKDLVDLMAVHPMFFIRKIQEKDKQFTYNLLESSGSKITESHIGKYPNLLQSLIIKNVKRQDHLKEIIALSLDQYNDMLFKDIKCVVGRFKTEYVTPFFIYLYEKQHYDIFNAFSYFNEQLKPTEKEMTLNAVFDYVFDSYNDLEDVSPDRFDMVKYIKPLLCFKYNEVNEKMISLKNEGKAELALLEDMEKYFLHNKLNEKLVEKNITEKRMKI